MHGIKNIKPVSIIFFIFFDKQYSSWIKIIRKKGIKKMFCGLAPTDRAKTTDIKNKKYFFKEIFFSVK